MRVLSHWRGHVHFVLLFPVDKAVVLKMTNEMCLHIYLHSLMLRPRVSFKKPLWCNNISFLIVWRHLWTDPYQYWLTFFQEMIEEADRDGDGEVNQEEFLRIMKKTSLYWGLMAIPNHFLVRSLLPLFSSIFSMFFYHVFSCLIIYLWQCLMSNFIYMHTFVAFCVC